MPVNGFRQSDYASGWNWLRKIRASKKTPQTGDKIVILGGENYRIGMGGAAVSSADTGALLWYRVKRNPTFESRNAKELPMPFVDW
jgi:phosphoribosylformylglycinamidine (FGAM) synthase-like enzyme